MNKTITFEMVDSWQKDMLSEIVHFLAEKKGVKTEDISDELINDFFAFLIGYVPLNNDLLEQTYETITDIN